MVRHVISVRNGAACATVLLAAASAHAQTAPTAPAGFTLSVFGQAPAGISNPDSIAVVKRNVWVGYGDNAAPDGSSGNSSVVEFSPSGRVMRVLTMPGHNDGLRLDPRTGYLYALQNEDAIPTVVFINPQTGSQSQPFSLPPVNGGGYDDVAFAGFGIFVSASNPALDANGFDNSPSLVSFPRFALGSPPTPIVGPNTQAVDAVTGQKVRLNLTDGDSTITTPSGDILLDSQGDGELVLVRPNNRAALFGEGLPSGKAPSFATLPGKLDALLDQAAGEPDFAQGHAVRISLLNGVQVDDTAYATSTSGTMYISDTPNNVVYALSSNDFGHNVPFSAAGPTAATTTTPAVPGFLGRLHLDTGLVEPLVTGMGSPHGLAFQPTNGPAYNE